MFGGWGFVCSLFAISQSAQTHLEDEDQTTNQIVEVFDVIRTFLNVLPTIVVSQNLRGNLTSSDWLLQLPSVAEHFSGAPNAHRGMSVFDVPCQRETIRGIATAKVFLRLKHQAGR